MGALPERRFHSDVRDRVHVESTDGRVRFRVLPALAARERLILTETIARRVRLLRTSDGLVAEEEPFDDAQPASALEFCQAATTSAWRNLASFRLPRNASTIPPES
jgi:hypothetical protein